MRKIGILTGGGDCPGLNAVIRGVVERCKADGIDVFGFLGGWRGAYNGEGKWLGYDDVDGIQTLGGTILESSRTNIIKYPDGPEKVRKVMDDLGLDCLVAVGGDDTLGVAAKLQQAGIDMIGVPKTIDNDISGTDYTFGFDTSANIAMECLDRLHTTAQSHGRVLVVEIMGRHTGWIAIQGGLAGNAHVVILPEFPRTLKDICDVIERRKQRGKRYAIVAVAEGAKIEGLELNVDDAKRDDFGNISLPDRALAENLAKAINKCTGIETRHVVLGHLQRGGSPSAFDRVLGIRMGIKAAELAINKDYGKMVAIRSTQIVAVPIDEGVKVRKSVDAELYGCAKLLER